jgi:two-component system sensor histidine kinase PilS (NtrC family)
LLEPTRVSRAPAIRVSRLLLLRTIVVTVVLGLSLWVVASGEGGATPAMWLQSLAIVATLVSSILFGVLLTRGTAPERLTTPMMASDLIVTSLLVYVTGGAQSPYTFLYALTIVAAGALAFRRGAIVVTAASIALSVAVAVLDWKHLIVLPTAAETQPWEQTGAALVRSLGINIATLIAVGVLSLFLSDQLERTDETLATTRREAADLLTLHQDIVRSLSSGLVTVAPDGTVLTANLAATEILRRPSDELVGKRLDELMPGLAAMLAEASDDLRKADLEVSTLGPDDLTLGVTVSPLRDKADTTFGRIVSFSDLTELRRLEHHMRRAERLATVGQLAAGVAHEIRNPLAAISGSIELLRAAPQASEDDRALMAIVHREIHRLNALIGDLLDYANPRPSVRVTFDLAGIVDETVQVARADAAFEGIELGCETERPLLVHGDPAKLRQVLWNLLRNARDAAAGGGKHVRVTAKAVDDGELAVSVSDDGAGMPPEQVAKIFDPFFTTKRGGTGLGLATSHTIIAEHGGRIDVASEGGAGTTMTVVLPARERDSAASV